METDNTQVIVNKLNSLELNTYPREEILSSFQGLRTIVPTVAATLECGRIVVRGTSYNSTDNFSQISRFSYKPKHLNTTYQRASIPQNTMFYGSITSNIQEEPNARMCVLAEIGRTYREGVPKETLMFSSWTVIKPINLIAIIQSEDYPAPCLQVLLLQRQYKKYFSEFSGRDFMNYIASQFAREDIHNNEDYKYMISAWFSKIVCDGDYDGVIYPSVRIDGAGMNVAIKPQAADEKLKFFGAAKCNVVKEGKNISVIEQEVTFFQEDGTLGYRPITNEDYNIK